MDYVFRAHFTNLWSWLITIFYLSGETGVQTTSITCHCLLPWSHYIKLQLVRSDVRNSTLQIHPILVCNSFCISLFCHVSEFSVSETLMNVSSLQPCLKLILDQTQHVTHSTEFGHICLNHNAITYFAWASACMKMNSHFLENIRWSFARFSCKWEIHQIRNKYFS